jgi:hypothetical protein
MNVMGKAAEAQQWSAKEKIFSSPVQCNVLKVESAERCYLKLDRFYRLTCWKDVADTQAPRDSTRYH